MVDISNPESSRDRWLQIHLYIQSPSCNGFAYLFFFFYSSLFLDYSNQLHIIYNFTFENFFKYNFSKEKARRKIFL